MKGAADAKASLAKYTAEARKFGIGLILATQLRDNVPGDLWGNIDTRLFMQALDQNERMRNAKAAGVDEHRLGSLLRGQAILVQSSQPHLRPVTIQIQPSWIKG
jgi:DNA helicase HerA-like ATPase